MSSLNRWLTGVLPAGVLFLGAGNAVLAQQPSPPPTAAAPLEDLSPYILTPPAPATPRINGPRLFGVRPGSPLLYTIPATGERPMTFEVKGLPKGLTADANAGQIRGVLNKPGKYKVTLRARNARGTATKEFTFVVGDTIALTPPMGWNSWNCWAGAVDQEKVLRAARAMVSTGLSQHGWTYINIDDAWQGARGGAFQAIQPDPVKFPDMKALCDEVHRLGLKSGIYSTPWVRSYAGRLGGSAENPEGKEQEWPGPPQRNRKVLPYAIGKYSFATNDARQWAAWGMDYLKYDWGPIEPPETKEMADALRATGRDIVYSVSNNSVGNVFNIVGELAPLVNAWRTTRDITDNWGRVSGQIGFDQERWAPYLSPGHYLDPDMLVVGYIGWGTNLRRTRLTPDEQYTHVTLWCLLSAPLLIGCDLERLDPFTLSLLTNDEVLAVDQDALVKPARRALQNGDIEVYVKELEDGSRAVGVFNRGAATAPVTVRWSEIGLTGKQRARDLWRQCDLGVMEDKIELTIAAHGAAMLKVTGAR